MALRDQPYLPLYIQDFLTDEKLSECSAQSTGVYIRIMCLMHKSEEYGTILLRQKDRQNESMCLNFAEKISKHMPYPKEVVIDSLKELLEEGVLKATDDRLIQPRMIKDNQLSLKRSASGKIGASATKFAEGFAKAKESANTEYENENISNTIINKKVEILENVFLHSKEVEKLKIEFGSNYQKALETLSNYKNSHGAKYKSDYHALIGWVKEKINTKKAGKSNPTGLVR